ncbi:MAG: hypothetical protein GX927_03790 [Lentisphaerae bacterium]|nr:hypothetical protein [Lentisphaerota bacterium]
MKFSNLTIYFRQKLLRRLSNDRGVAMLYTAVVCMFILAVFSLIHDVGRISEDKMQMQNAADAAALEFATWQARGMNTVQNLNQEIYNLDSFVITMYYAGAALTWVGQAAKGVLGAGVIVDAFAAGLFYGGAYIHHFIGIGMLQTLRHFYAFGTNILAYIAANELAAKNGAASIPDLPKLPGHAGNGTLGNMISSLVNTGARAVHVLCIPTTFDTMFTLPLTGEKGKNQPLNIRFSEEETVKELGGSLGGSLGDFLKNQPPDSSQEENNKAEPLPDIPDENKIEEMVSGLTDEYADILIDAITNSFMELIMESAIKVNTCTCFLDWDFFTWQDSYYRSDTIESKENSNDNLPYNSRGKTSLPPVLAVVYKKQNTGLLSRYLLQAESPIPVLAYAVARCEGGNVDAYFSKDSNYRSGTHGVSASAVLVPFSKISEVWAEQEYSNDILEIMQFMNGIFLH